MKHIPLVYTMHKNTLCKYHCDYSSHVVILAYEYNSVEQKSG